jgi:hypothetical protein
VHGIRWPTGHVPETTESQPLGDVVGHLAAVLLGVRPGGLHQVPDEVATARSGPAAGPQPTINKPTNVVSEAERLRDLSLTCLPRSLTHLDVTARDVPVALARGPHKHDPAPAASKKSAPATTLARV